MRGTWCRAPLGALVVCVLVSLAPRGARADSGVRAIDEAADARLLSYGKQGLRLGTKLLAAGAVDAAAYDPAQDLIWLLRKGTLMVLDLRVDGGKPVAIAKKWPQQAFEVRGLSSVTHDVDYAGLYPVLDLTAPKKPKIAEGSGAYGGLWEDQDKAARKQLKKVKIVGQKWLKQQANRARRELLPGPPEETLAPVALPEGMGECDDPADCGTAQRFGATPFQLVLVAVRCGDACSSECVLHDVSRKRFATPAETGAWGKTATPGACTGYGFDVLTTTYFSGTSVCMVDASGIRCREQTVGTPFGWLDPNGADGIADPQTPGAIMLVDLTKLATRACKCKDAACATAAGEALEAFADANADTPLDEAEQAEVQAQIARATACIGKRLAP